MNGMSRIDTILRSHSQECSFVLPENYFLIPLWSFCILKDSSIQNCALSHGLQRGKAQTGMECCWWQLVIRPIERIWLRNKKFPDVDCIGCAKCHHGAPRLMYERAWMQELCNSFVFCCVWLDSLSNPLTCGKQYLNKLQPMILKHTRVAHLIITIVSFSKLCCKSEEKLCGEGVLLWPNTTTRMEVFILRYQQPLSFVISQRAGSRVSFWISCSLNSGEVTKMKNGLQTGYKIHN